MRIKIHFCLIFLSLVVISCKDDTSDSIPKFEGFTLRESEDGIVYEADPSDWNLDDKFSELERSLFDTLKFESAFLKEGYIEVGDAGKTIAFYPNPVQSTGYLSANFPSIMNIVIVDRKFNKKMEFRGQIGTVAFDMSMLPKGIYRMYYVSQATDYTMIGAGHGDIIVGDEQ
jgi:hypothetical protein